MLRSQQQPGAPAYRSGPVLVRTRRPLKGGRLQNLSPQTPLASSPSPAPVARSEYDAKPVTEDIEEGVEVQGPFVPALKTQTPHLSALSSHQPAPRVPQPKLLPQSQFFDPNPLGEDDGPVLTRFQPQERPTAVPVQVARFNPQQNAQKIHRPTPAAYQQQQEERHVRPTPRYNNHEKERKPVAQILRKYREEHEDGTITWGFENDDGSFKEETIGIDCVTR